MGSSRNEDGLAKETLDYVQKSEVGNVVAIDLPPLDSEAHDATTRHPNEAAFYTVAVVEVKNG